MCRLSNHVMDPSMADGQIETTSRIFISIAKSGLYKKLDH